MPIGFRSAAARRNSAKPVPIDLQELVDNQTSQFPLVCRPVSDHSTHPTGSNGTTFSSSSAASVGSTDSKHVDNANDALVVHGEAVCPTLNLRHPVVTSPGSPPPAAALQRAWSCRMASVCLSDSSLLFERVSNISGDSAPSSFTASDSPPSGSEHRTTHTRRHSGVANGYVYGGRLYSSLRSLLTCLGSVLQVPVQPHATAGGGGTRMAVRVRADNVMRNSRNSSPHEEYIVFPHDVKASGNGDGRQTFVSAWKVSTAAGRVYLQAVELALDEEKRWKACENANYLNAQELSRLLAKTIQEEEACNNTASSEEAQSGMLLVRALPVRNQPPSPVTMDRSAESSESVQLMPLHVFSTSSKPFLLVSRNSQCFLLSRDVRLTVVAVAGTSPAGTGSNTSSSSAHGSDASTLASIYQSSVSALASFLMSSPILSYGLCKISVCDQPIEKQLARPSFPSPHRRSTQSSVSSSGSLDMLMRSAGSELFYSVFHTPPPSRRAGETSPNCIQQGSGRPHHSDQSSCTTEEDEAYGRKESLSRRTSVPTLPTPEKETIDPYSWVRRSQSLDPETVSKALQQHVTKPTQLHALTEAEPSDAPPPLPNRLKSVSPDSRVSLHSPMSPPHYHDQQQQQQQQHGPSASPVNSLASSATDEGRPKLPQKRIRFRRSAGAVEHNVYGPPMPLPRSAHQDNPCPANAHSRIVVQPELHTAGVASDEFGYAVLPVQSPHHCQGAPPASSESEPGGIAVTTRTGVRHTYLALN